MGVSQDNGDDMARYLRTLLQDQSEATLAFADHVQANHDDCPDYQYAQPRLADLAMWGIDEAEWGLVGRGFHMERLSARLSQRCPAVILAPYSGTEDVQHRMCLVAGQEIRHQAVEDWLNREIEPQDWATLQEFTQALPDGWMLVLEARSRHAHEIDPNDTLG
jgi:hypothetical protein